MSLEIWKEKLSPILERIIETKPNEEDIPFLGSIITILNYNPTIQPIDKVIASHIDELISEKLDHFVAYSDEKSDFQTTGAEIHQEYALIELNKMLKLDEEIADILYRSATKEEKEHIKKSYDTIAESMKK